VILNNNVQDADAHNYSRRTLSVPLYHYGICPTMNYMNVMDGASCLVLPVKIVPSCN
jgi:hypothetical protein